MVPTDTLVTTPEELIVATAALVLLQVPVPVASVSVVLLPMHTPEGPEMAAGKGLTITFTVAPVSE